MFSTPLYNALLRFHCFYESKDSHGQKTRNTRQDAVVDGDRKGTPMQPLQRTRIASEDAISVLLASAKKNHIAFQKPELVLARQGNLLQDKEAKAVRKGQHLV